MKRIISLLIVISTLLSLFVFSPAGASLEESKYTNDIEEILAIGIMEGDENGNFNPLNNITRAEFAKIISVIDGIDMNVVPGIESGFFDLETDHWAYNYIYYAVSRGYMKGYPDGSFMPDEAITGNEAIKMLISLAGYDFRAVDSGGYPTGYVMVAHQLGITNGLDMDYNDCIYRDEAARLINNTLDVPYVEQIGIGKGQKFEINNSKTLLNVKFKMDRGNGVMLANDIAYIGLNSATGKNQVNIDGVIINTEDDSIRNYLGYKVRYIYKTDELDEDKFHLVYIRDDETKSTVVDKDDFVSYKDNYFTYKIDENERTKNLKVLQNADFILNGENVAYYDGIFDMDMGSITLLESYSSGIDVVIINKFNVMTVGFIDISRELLTDKYNPSIKLDFGNSDKVYSIQDYNGNEIDLTKIKKDDIVTYCEGSDYVNIYVGASSEKGKITIVGEPDELELNGIVYNRNYYSQENNIFNINDNVTVYFDYFGNISDIRITTETDQFYYLVKYNSVKVVDTETIYVKFYTPEGKFETYTFGENVTIDDRFYKNVTESALLLQLGSQYDQVVSVRLEDGKIKEMRTSKKADEFSENDDGFCMLYPGRARQFASESYCFDFELYVNDSIPFMVIPANPGTANERSFSVYNYRSFTSGSPFIEGYTSSKLAVLPELVVVRVEDSAAEAFEGHDIVGVIQSISEVRNEDGEKATKLHVLKGNYSDSLYERDIFAYSEDNLTSTNNVVVDGDTIRKTYTISDLKVGDAIKIMYDKTDGRLQKFQVYYKVDEQNPWLGVGETEVATAINRINERVLTDLREGYFFARSTTDSSRIEQYPADTINIIVVEKNASGKYKVFKGTQSDIIPGDTCVIQVISRKPFSIIIYK